MYSRNVTTSTNTLGNNNNKWKYPPCPHCMQQHADEQQQQPLKQVRSPQIETTKQQQEMEVSVGSKSAPHNSTSITACRRQHDSNKTSTIAQTYNSNNNPHHNHKTSSVSQFMCGHVLKDGAVFCCILLQSTYTG